MMMMMIMMIIIIIIVVIFCAVTPNICGSSVWNLLHISLPGFGIYRWLLEFW